MNLGAHVSSAGKLEKAADKGQSLGCTCIQIFAGSPMMWKMASYEAAEIQNFRQKIKDYNIDPVVIHALYLVNMATSNAPMWKKSVDYLVHTLQTGEQIGARSVIVHPGSFGEASREAGMARVVAAIKAIFKAYSGPVELLLETTAGMGNSLASKFEDLREMIEKSGKPRRLGICLDTAHVFEAGYDLSTVKGFQETMKALEKNGLHTLLRAVHLNDSKTPCGSKVDRHENIGEGHIGKEAIRRLIRHPYFKSSPLILETPGFDRQGPDLKNMKIVRALDKAGRKK